MKNITLAYSHLSEFVKDKEINDYQKKVSECHGIIHKQNGPDSNYLGWIDLSNNYNRIEF